MRTDVQPTPSSKSNPFSSIGRFFSNNFGVDINNEGFIITTPLGKLIGTIKNDSESTPISVDLPLPRP